MDDCLGSVKNSKTALMLRHSLAELLKLGGFNLKKIFSNVPNLSLKLLHGCFPKMLSIPKLELQAALLASRLKDHIEKTLTLSISKVFM